MFNNRNLISLMELYFIYHTNNLLLLPIVVIAAKFAGPFSNILVFILPLLIIEKLFLSEVTEGLRSFRYLVPVSRSQIVLADFGFIFIIMGIVTLSSLIPVPFLFHITDFFRLSNIPFFLCFCCFLLFIFNGFGFQPTMVISFIFILGLLVSSFIKINPFIFFTTDLSYTTASISLSAIFMVLSLVIVNRKSYNPASIAKDL